MFGILTYNLNSVPPLCSESDAELNGPSLSSQFDREVRFSKFDFHPQPYTLEKDSEILKGRLS